MAFALTSASAVPAVGRSVSRLPFRSSISARQQRLVARAEIETKQTASGTTEVVASDFDGEKLLKEWQDKWDRVEDKTSVAVYAAGALTLLWLSSTLVSAINNVPVLPKLMELVGLGYTAWFVYRYLLFKDSRKELITDVDELKKKISGDDKF